LGKRLRASSAATGCAATIASASSAEAAVRSEKSSP
jgi:hypothetical protein